MQAQLKLERAARQDLEMHTDALVAQKTLTHQEILILTQEVEKCECNMGPYAVLRFKCILTYTLEHQFCLFSVILQYT